MKDRVINEVFSYPFLGNLKVVESADGGSCIGCVFSNRLAFCSNDSEKFHTGQCSKEYRMDHKDVIFIKAKGL